MDLTPQPDFAHRTRHFSVYLAVRRLQLERIASSLVSAMTSCNLDSSVHDGLPARFISNQTTPSMDMVKRDRSAFEVLEGIDSNNVDDQEQEEM